MKENLKVDPFSFPRILFKVDSRYRINSSHFGRDSGITMEALAPWRSAMTLAKTPEDWNDIDKLAIEVMQRGVGNHHDAREALGLVISRLRGSPGLPIEPGDPSETWLHHALQAIWVAMSHPMDAQDAFYEMPFSAHSINKDNKVVGVTRLWCALLGFGPGEVLGRRSYEFLTDDSRKTAIEEYLPRFWEAGHITDARYDMVHKSGKIIPVSLSAVAEFDEYRHPIRSIAIITPR